MSSLTLLKEDDVQKSWKNYTRVHGVYALSFSIDELRQHYDNTTSVIYDNNHLWIRTDITKLLKSLFIGNVQLDQKQIRIIGKFVKIGKVVLFEPLEEQF